MARLFAGTSGFAYPSWKPGFYPDKMPASKFLAHYASRLNAVEINYTFRRNPAPATLAGWVEATPAGFVFAVKAHQRITHMARLKNAGDATAFFLRSLEPLRTAGRLGPVLFQLPPQLRCDVPLLDAFLAELPRDLRYAFEFRHDSWLSEPVYSALRRYGVSLCVAESEKFEVPEVITCGFVYYRLRKPDYTAEDIAAIAGRAAALLAEDKDLYLIFKHEETPQGALHAEQVLGRFTGRLTPAAAQQT